MAIRQKQLEDYLRDNCELSVNPVYTFTKYGPLRVGTSVVVVDKTTGKILLKEVRKDGR